MATPLPRTQAEILARIEEATPRDPFGFEHLEYIEHGLTFESAKPWLTEEATPDAWTPPAVERVDTQAKDYLAFWLEKIEGERGISVCRATAHFTAWKWLLGHPDADTFPGSVKGGDGGWYQRDANDYIQAQITSGEWDRLTRSALEARP